MLAAGYENLLGVTTQLPFESDLRTWLRIRNVGKATLSRRPTTDTRTEWESGFQWDKPASWEDASGGGHKKGGIERNER